MSFLSLLSEKMSKFSWVILMVIDRNEKDLVSMSSFTISVNTYNPHFVPCIVLGVRDRGRASIMGI